MSVRPSVDFKISPPPSFPPAHAHSAASAKSLFCKWSCRPSCLLDVACMSAFQYVIRAFKSVLHCWESILCTYVDNISSLFLICPVPDCPSSSLTHSPPVTLRASAYPWRDPRLQSDGRSRRGIRDVSPSRFFFARSTASSPVCPCFPQQLVGKNHSLEERGNLSHLSL